MRCKKCKKWLPLLTRYCSNCGTAVVLEQRLKSEWLMLLGMLLVVFGLSFWSSRVTGEGMSASSLTAVAAGLGSAILVLLLGMAIIFCFAFVDLVRFAAHKPKFIPLPIVAILLLAGGGYAVWLLTSYASAAGLLPLIQDSLVETASAKFMGDKLAQGKAAPQGYAWWRVQGSAQRAAQILTGLPVPDRLEGYRKSAVVWAARMADVAKDQKAWDTVAEEPADFALAINQRSARDLFTQSLERLASLKEFGDLAIKDKDNQAVRYVAARLLVQRHWLQNLVRSRDPGFLAVVPIAPAQAADERRICVPGAENKEICAADILGHVELMYRAARDILDGRDKAENAWNEAWDKAAKEKGLVLPEPAEAGAKYPPAVQAFMDRCYERGGELGAKIEKRDQLPTDEEGETCGFQKGQSKCWDLLTDSGARYGGGEGGCPQVGVIPAPLASAWPAKPADSDKKTEEAKPADAGKTPPAARTPTAAPKPQAGSWDGNYAVSGVLDCGGNIPGTEPKLPINSGFTVSGNSVTDVNGIRRAISAQGTVTLYSDQIIQGMNGAFKTTYTFRMSKGTATVSGYATVDLVFAQGTTRYESRCAGTLSGSRR